MLKEPLGEKKRLSVFVKGRYTLMQFYALIEEWPGESIVFFRELPGCYASAATTEGAIQAAPAAITNYFRWLKENDLAIIEQDNSPISIVVKELLSSGGESIGPLFETDRAEPDELEMDIALNVAATARALIIELVANVPSHLHEQVLTPGGWSLTQHLRHIMESENWYVSRLQEHPRLEASAPSMSADDIAMKIFEDAMDNEIILHELTAEQRTRVFVHGGEAWTAAKVLRREAEHLREHYPWMEEIANQISART